MPTLTTDTKVKLGAAITALVFALTIAVKFFGVLSAFDTRMAVGEKQVALVQQSLGALTTTAEKMQVSLTTIERSVDGNVSALKEKVAALEEWKSNAERRMQRLEDASRPK